MGHWAMFESSVSGRPLIFQSRAMSLSFSLSIRVAIPEQRRLCGEPAVAGDMVPISSFQSGPSSESVSRRDRTHTLGHAVFVFEMRKHGDRVLIGSDSGHGRWEFIRNW